MPPSGGAQSRHVLRRLLLPSAVIGTGAVFAYSLRPRTIPGSSCPQVPPPTCGSDGRLRLPQYPTIKPRSEQLRDLQRSSSSSSSSSSAEPGDAAIYDALIIGGGATGAGVALDAATRGLRVALVERDDFASGTSSKSTKLVHGGVRYLEKAVWELDYGQYRLVREALKERKTFLHTAPHLSSWLPIMLPLTSWLRAPYYWAGTKFYDLLAGSEGIESSYFLPRSKALEAFPMLRPTGLVGALVYYDGAHNDSRMNVSLAVTAALYGATVANYVEVTRLLKDADGRLCGAAVRDRIAERDDPATRAGRRDNVDNHHDNEITIRARCVINCTGPFADSIRKLDDQHCADIVAPSLGVHVVLPGYYSPANMGLLDPSTSDGRVIFFLPWQGNTIAGTTDTPAVVAREPVPDEASIEWILREIRGYLAPEISVRRGDVLAAWAGIRPLVKDPHGRTTESLVRSHLVDVNDSSGLLTCAGGKWTTYRQMAEDCVDAAVARFALTPGPPPRRVCVSGCPAADDSALLDGSCQTHRVRLVGAHGYSPTLFIPLIQHFGIETEVARHLAESYGDRAWDVAALCSLTDSRFPARGERISRLYPFVDGEIRYAVRHELAQTAVDVLARRTRLAFLNAQAALEALPRVIDIMGDELRWSRHRRDLEWVQAVDHLKSMGLPRPMHAATRQQVEQGQLDFKDSLEWSMYSRHDKPSSHEE